MLLRVQPLHSLVYFILPQLLTLSLKTRKAPAAAGALVHFLIRRCYAASCGIRGDQPQARGTIRIPE